MVLTGNEATFLSTIAGVLLIACISFTAWIVKKLGQHDTALKIILLQLNPPGEKSLRDMLTEIRVEQARQGPP